MEKTRILGRLRAEVFGACPEAVINRCASAGIELGRTEYAGPCTLIINISQLDRGALEDICCSCGCEMKILSIFGGSRMKEKLLKRLPFLISAILICLCLVLSSLFVWDIDIVSDGECNEERILNVLSKNGLDIGSYWPGISPDMLRSELLTELPELSWMTVNVSGSRAMVLVKMREEVPEIFEEKKSADIVSSRSGRIVDMQVFNGNPLVRAGDEVSEGQTLIGGFAESLSNPPRYLRAKGSVIAETRREMTAVAPEKAERRGELKRRRLRYAVKFGKKRFNLYFNSRKSIDGCVKIIKEYNLGIEGLFALPLSIVREELLSFEKTEGICMTEDKLEENLLSYAMRDTEGELLSAEYSQDISDGLVKVSLRAVCLEEIGELMERQVP